jgi:excisionase family DNA binding protein
MVSHSIQRKRPALDVPFAERAFTFGQACKILTVCENTARTLIRKGELESFRVGRRHLVSGRAIKAYMAIREKAARRTVPS